MNQDKFYKKKEANSFYNRWKINGATNSFVNNGLNKYQKALRPYKKEILDVLKSKVNIKKKKVLEVGSFIGDLLWELKKEHKCDVYGVEPSSLACSHSKKHYGLKVENSTFLESSFFNLSKKNKEKFDIIVCDDVLSWIDRSCILSCIAVMDWILKPKGHIFIRDYSPSYNFAIINHHCQKEKIYNFKQKDGHAKFFLDSGKYSKIYNKKYISSKYQNVSIENKMALTISDIIIEKDINFTHTINKFK